MKIVKFKKISNDKYKVFLENGEVIALYEEIILKNNLLLSKEIIEEEKEGIEKQNNNYNAYNLALKYISNKMRSKKEIREYLTKKEIENNNIELIIQKLENQCFVNDSEYAKAYVKDQLLLSNNGPQKIKNNLINLGIEESIVDKYVNNIDEILIKEKLSKLIDKKLKIKNGSKTMIKLKLINYFYNLGYDKELILQILNNSDIKTDYDKLKKEYSKLYAKYSKKYQGDELKKFITQKLLLKGYTKEDIKNTEI